MADELVFTYAGDIEIRQRHNSKVVVEMSKQGPTGNDGPRGFTGTVTPEMIDLRDEAVAAADLAAGAQDSIAASISAATNAATAAETARAAAVTARTGSETARTASEAARTGAETARTGAETAQSSATASRTAAETAATNAATARTGSEGARDKALEWAEKAVDTPVEAGAFSAKHHATKAAASSTSAGTSATTATNAATAAETARAATVAARDITTAARDAAATSATNSANSASAAAASAASITQPDVSGLVPKTISLAAGVNINTIIESGFYRLQASATNGPVEYAHSQLIVSRGGDTIVQMIYPYGGGRVSLRVGSAIGGANTFLPWRTCFDSSNLPAIGEVTGLTAALAAKAALASPALTGTPTAPTAAQTVDNTQIATTAFVKAAIAALVGSSPAALDTLNELAVALGNDPNFATTITNALAGKAATVHVHAIADVTNLQSTLDGKAATAHVHTTAQITGLDTALAAKAPLAAPAFTGGITVTGDIVASGNVSAYSDARLKSNVSTIDGALEKVLMLRGVYFEMNGKRGTGVIAQEFQAVVPELVHENDDEAKTLSVVYGNTIGLLIEAIKELTARVVELEKAA